MAALALVGCGTTSNQVTEIRFWNGFTGPDGAKMLQIVRAFNQENPDVKVTMQRIEWGTYYNKLFVAGLAGRAPDVFVLHAPTITRFVEGGFMMPLDKVISKGFPINDIDPNVWAAVSVKGQHYAVPLDVHTLGAYYNTQIISKAPQTQDEFIRAMQGATDAKKHQWGFGISNAGSTAFSFMNQFGGKFFTPDGMRCVMNNPENARALQFCADLIWKYHVAPPLETDTWAAFRQGHVALTYNGIYMLPDLQKQTDLHFAGAPIATVGNQPGVWASSHSLCMKANLDDKKAAAGWRFIHYLSDHSLQWAEAGQVPVRRSIRETAKFKSFQVQHEFAKQVSYVRYFPKTSVVFEFEAELNHAVETVLRKSATPEAALAEAEKNLNRTLDRRNAAMKRAKELAR